MNILKYKIDWSKSGQKRGLIQVVLFFGLYTFLMLVNFTSIFFIEKKIEKIP